jgi:hypothetical protein
MEDHLHVYLVCSYHGSWLHPPRSRSIQLHQREHIYCIDDNNLLCAVGPLYLVSTLRFN